MKIDGALYGGIRERKDKLILESVHHPLISLELADDEFGTNARISADTIKFRHQVQDKTHHILDDLISIFENQLVKMENKFRDYIK
ncbi:hypothetical protein QW71_05240 [Paenibacillus sp. IHB B 3415]|uniref:hypothetical protein n=1 Tax=Paenibacillus sp. IHB B 3415 TaxID=867080 RepID=UPI000574F344|nr:hypothetical protein [Paenibacillus sp. IHB B 3415]KHL96800.1 hypothetical protein QW71_05240 [Paenibacillus sp. IHB B 3415]